MSFKQIEIFVLPPLFHLSLLHHQQNMFAKLDPKENVHDFFFNCLKLNWLQKPTFEWELYVTPILRQELAGFPALSRFQQGSGLVHIFNRPGVARAVL